MLPKFLEDLDPEIYGSGNYVVLDFEVDTAHGDYGNPVHEKNGLLLACWKKAGQPVKALWGSEFDMSPLLEDIAEADFVVAHHSKYELGWLIRAGADPRKLLFFDTKLAEYVLMGNLASGDEMMRGRDLDLDTCCLRRGLPAKDPVVDTMIHHQINPASIPPVWLEGRCRQDVETTEAVFLSQLDSLRRTNRLAVLYTRCLLTPVLAAVEREGIALDHELVRKTHAEYKQKFVALEQQMNTMTGGINWRSSKQAGEYIYDVLKFDELRHRSGEPKRTKGRGGVPARKTDNKTLDQLKAATAKQKEFVKLRKELGKVSFALTKNLDFYLGVVEEYGGTFYGEFNQANTATHRLSSSGIPLKFRMFKDITGKKELEKKVQFQNQPRAFKKLVMAKRPGWVIFDPDGSQLEFRVAAFLGQDQQAMQDISDPLWDAHVTSGAAMAAMAYADLYRLYIDGDEKGAKIRQDAKPETFKPLYGGEFGTKAQMRWYEEFKRRYAGIAETQREWAAQVAKDKVLVTAWGLRYYWPHARVDKSGRLNVKNAVYNYPVQALATAEIIPIAMVYFWHRIREEGLEDYCYVINTVHDSMPCEVHPDYLERVEKVAKRAFTTDVYNYLRKVYGIDFNVPLGVGIKSDRNWGQGKERSYNIWPDGREECVKGC